MKKLGPEKWSDLSEETEPGGGRTRLEARCAHCSHDTSGLTPHLHLIPILPDSYGPSSITLRGFGQREPSAGGILIQCSCLHVLYLHILKSINQFCFSASFYSLIFQLQNMILKCKRGGITPKHFFTKLTILWSFLLARILHTSHDCLCSISCCSLTFLPTTIICFPIVAWVPRILPGCFQGPHATQDFGCSR